MSAVTGPFTPEEEQHIKRMLRAREVAAEVRRRASAGVRTDAVEDADHFVELVDDRAAVRRSFVDACDELLDLLAVHDASPSGVGSAVAPADASTDTVGDSAPDSSAPSGGVSGAPSKPLHRDLSATQRLEVLGDT